MSVASFNSVKKFTFTAAGAAGAVATPATIANFSGTVANGLPLSQSGITTASKVVVVSASPAAVAPLNTSVALPIGPYVPGNPNANPPVPVPDPVAGFTLNASGTGLVYVAGAQDQNTYTCLVV